MHLALTILSSLIYFVLAASVLAVVPGVVTWRVLRWSTGCPVPFNRTYYASLLWMLLGGALTLLVLLAGGDHGVALQQPLASPWLRLSLLLNMLLGVVLTWRLVPRGDGYRITVLNACTSVAVVTVVAIGVLSVVHA